MFFASLDTHFLLALERGNELCQQAIDELRSLNGFPIITTTVARHLALMAERATQEEARRIARNTLIHVPTFVVLERIGGFDQNCQKIADVLLAGPLSGVTNVEALIVAEAANENCELLITLRQSLLDIRFQKVASAVEKETGKSLIVCHPAVFIGAAQIIRKQQQEKKTKDKDKGK